jgi:hypothetical protein
LSLIKAAAWLIATINKRMRESFASVMEFETLRLKVYEGSDQGETFTGLRPHGLLPDRFERPLTSVGIASQ